MPGEEFVDDYDIAPGRVIVGGEDAACQQRRTKSFEVTREDRLRVGILEPAGIGKGLFGSPARTVETTSEWEWGGGGYVFDARQRTQALLNVVHERGALRGLSATAASRELDGENTGGFVSGFELGERGVSAFLWVAPDCGHGDTSISTRRFLEIGFIGGDIDNFFGGSFLSLRDTKR